MEPITKEAYDILYNIVLEDTARLVGIEYDKLINKKMLKIQNIHKIFGKEVDSKWLPNSKDWVVNGIEEVGDTYIFELFNSNGRFNKAEIQLRREPLIDAMTLETVYELWAWNIDNGRPEILSRKIEDMATIKDMSLWLGYMIDKIVPKNS